MPTTASCGWEIASSLTQVIAERRSEKYSRSKKAKYVFFHQEIFFAGDNGGSAGWLLVQKDSWQERTDRDKQGVAFDSYFIRRGLQGPSNLNFEILSISANIWL